MKKKSIAVLLILLLITGLALTSCGQKPDINKQPEHKLISIEEAKKIAMDHFKLDLKDVSFIKEELDKEGADEKYDLEFEDRDYKYEIEIGAVDSKILSFEKEARKKDGASPDEIIDEEKARALVLEKLPNSKKEDFKSFKLEKDDGILKYEGSLIQGNKEYEFEIDAKTGQIIKWEEEVR